MKVLTAPAGVTYSLTHSPNNIGLRDASASKNHPVERAQNYGSKTHVEKLNWTSTTNFCYKTLCYIFVGTSYI